MIEVQLKDGSFLTINPNLIKTIKSNKTTKKYSNGVEYTVNDYITGDEFTVTFTDGETIALSKLGLDILRQKQPRADFDPQYFKLGINSL